MFFGYGSHVLQWTTALTASVRYAFWAVCHTVDYCFNDVYKLCFLGRPYGSHVAQWTTALTASVRYASGYGSHVAPVVDYCFNGFCTLYAFWAGLVCRTVD